MTEAHAIEAAILALVAERGRDKSVCPSELARALGGEAAEWQARMKPVRAAAVRLAEQRRISILRKGRPVDPGDFKGLYRLSLPRG